MDSKVWDRVAALAGVASVVLFLVGGFLQGNLPGVGDSASDVVSFFADERGRFLAGAVIQGLGVVAAVWFVASLTTAMRRTGEDRLAVTASYAFVIFVTLVGVGALTQAGLAYDADVVDPETALVVYHTSLVLDTFAWLLGAALFVAIGAASVRSGILPRGWGIVTGLIGLLLLVGATGLARDGFWSPTGGLQAVADTVFFVWVIVTSVLHFREVARAG